MISSSPSSELNQEEEAIFKEHFNSMGALGYGGTSSEVVSMASNYTEHLRKLQVSLFSIKWFMCFMER